MALSLARHSMNTCNITHLGHYICNSAENGSPPATAFYCRPNAMKKLSAIDLFSGCGGLTLGLKQADFKVLAAIECDELAAAVYKANHPRVKLYNEDIRKVAASRVLKDTQLAPGELDLLAGCPPCQGFSVLRTRNGAGQRRDDRNALIAEMLRFARAFRPKAVMMENVPGLSKHHSFLGLCRDLRKLGYKVRWDIKDARYFDVPQRRRRLILVAGLGFEIPFGTESQSSKTVRQAIGHLQKAGKSDDTLHNLPEKRSAKIAALIRDIPKDGGSRGDLPRSRQLPCHQRVDGFKDIYGRMAWDLPAPTITGGCFNPSKGRFLHPDEDRAITLREAALLQSFPASYQFPVSTGKEALALMIGNALPPAFIRRHAAEIRKSVAGVSGHANR